MICIVDKETAIAMLRDSFEFWGAVVRMDPELGLLSPPESVSGGEIPKGTAEAIRSTMMQATMLSEALKCGQASCVYESDGLRETIAYFVRTDGKVRCLSELSSGSDCGHRESCIVAPASELELLKRAVRRATKKAAMVDESDIAEYQKRNYIIRRYESQFAALQLAMKEGVSMVDVCLEGDVLETVGYRRLPTGELLEVTINHQRELMGL